MTQPAADPDSGNAWFTWTRVQQCAAIRADIDAGQSAISTVADAAVKAVLEQMALMLESTWSSSTEYGTGGGASTLWLIAAPDSAASIANFVPIAAEFREVAQQAAAG